ncbi:hypothetical protein N0V84_012678 [Fusarium piperis]|uniref:Uncharacterized protein n=1 Tax=Fusarium piperis TaxID=1435070 RepID=A0A9W8TB10_9HYPO|nr:hypothetical protein N0V84_012678 [Fusarium piperis]
MDKDDNDPSPGDDLGQNHMPFLDSWHPPELLESVLPAEEWTEIDFDDTSFGLRAGSCGAADRRDSPGQARHPDSLCRTRRSLSTPAKG